MKFNKLKFKIVKRVTEYGTFYHTYPTWFFSRIISFFRLEMGGADSTRSFSTERAARLHIKRYNNGYYKKKYYQQVLEV